MTDLNRSALVLKGALELWRDDPKRWCQWELSRCARGRGVYLNSRYAVSWCAAGAVVASGRSFIGLPIRSILDMGDVSIGEWNDAPGRTFVEVRDRFTAYFGLCAIQGG